MTETPGSSRRQFAVIKPRFPGARHVAIISFEADEHAHAIADELGQTSGIRCSIVAVDRLPGSMGLTWSSTSPSDAVLPTMSGDNIRVEDIDLIWWRRLNSPRLDAEPKIPPEVSDEAARDLIINDCRDSLLGLLLTEFDGVWVNHPEATRRAANKLVQIRAAQTVGLRVPKTLVSQDPAAIRRFVAGLGGEAVVKVVTGTRRAPLHTGRVTQEMLAEDVRLGLCPAIYQEYVPGTRHLRVCCFGEACHTAILECEALDWRSVPITVEQSNLSAEVESKLREVLRLLGLRMGIFDLKLADRGEPFWFEVNPQGQFLFLEALCSMRLRQAFSDFLLAELAA